MLELTWPTAARVNGWRLAVEAHTRGVASREGAGTFGRGSGAHLAGEVALAPMTADDALSVRAFLHRLRGRSGSFLLTVPGTEFIASGGGLTSGALAAGASSATLTGIGGTENFKRGTWAVIGSVTAGGQLVRITSVSGSTMEFRPHLRAAIGAGTTALWGPVQGLFRLSEQTPIVSIRPEGCPGLVLEIEEFY